MVLVVVQLHDAPGDVGFESGVVVGQVGQGVDGHDAPPGRRHIAVDSKGSTLVPACEGVVCHLSRIAINDEAGAGERDHASSAPAS